MQHRGCLLEPTPAEMIVMDSKSGKEIAHLPTAEGMDGVYFDSLRKRVYVSGGRGLPAGFAYVYQQRGADRYETIGKISTRGGAGTSFWSPELDRYYVAAPATDKERGGNSGLCTAGLNSTRLRLVSDREDRRHRSCLQTGPRRTTDYATVLLRLPEISNDLEVVRLL